MDPREISHLSIEEKKARFRQVTVTHRLLEQTHRKIVQAVREPAGFTFVLVYGPTGVGKSKMIETVVRQLGEELRVPSTPALLRPLPGFLTPVLVIEADPPDRSVFNRGYYYRTALTLMGEPTYQQHLHMDIHGEAQPSKRRPLRGKAAESNDLPELKEATKEAMPRHGVQVVMIDEAHHMLYGGNGTAGSTLQEQLEWLKSLSSTTHIIHILVGTYDLLNFGKLNGQIGRRCLPVHFSRYLLQREADCLEFQSALVSLLEHVPLRCDVETLVRSYWVYFYEGCIGCIGVLKDWLVRAVSAALDEGEARLTLDCLHDHILPTDILRQMALDASEGEQKPTESNREHLWRILQGGEQIAPIPPLPPRETSPQILGSPVPVPVAPETSNGSTPSREVAPLSDAEQPKVKKTRSRKKAEATLSSQEPASMIQASDPTPEVVPKPARTLKELADFLRTRRARLQPADVGLPPGLRRKTAGLRREEIAQLANVSVTWYTWLEQGRAIQVSEQVLESLAHALLLHADEKAHLFFLARQTLPPDSVSRQETVSPLLQRFLDQLEPNPAYLTGRRWDLLAWNRAACVVLGEVDAFAPEQRNILRLVFTDQEFRQRVVDWEVVAQRVLAQFRLSSGCATGDPGSGFSSRT
jgi:transcriptional regulator with XRE-family HTH domain